VDPGRRAYDRNDAAIARQARQEKAVIYRGDKMGLRSDQVSGTSFAPRGQAPIVCATGQRFGCNMISAISNRGRLAFMVFHGKFDGRRFIRFMQRLRKQTPGKLYLTVDGHSVHRSVAAREFVNANDARLRLIRLPGYCPELNADELLNHDAKTNCLGKSRPGNRTEMIAGIRSHLRRRQRQPQVIRNRRLVFFVIELSASSRHVLTQLR
jgi:DDE superfamily endonuclease